MADTAPSYPGSAPDTSWQAYSDYVNSYAPGLHVPRAYTALAAWLTGKSNYATWSQNVLNDYNHQVEAYNAYASSPAGNREQLEQAGYNVNYSPGTVSQGSPLNYQIPDPGTGAAEAGGMVNGILQFVSAIQGFKMAAANIAGKNLENELLWKKISAQDIINKHLDDIQYWKGRNLAYKTDFQQFQNEAYLYSLLKGEPGFDPKSWGAYYRTTDGSHGTMYDLSRSEHGLAFQKATQELEALKTANQLRKTQESFLKMSEKEKKFVVDNIQGVQKELLEKQRDLLGGQVKFQPIQQRVWRNAQRVNMGSQVVNTTLQGIKLFLPGGAFSMPSFAGGSGVPNMPATQIPTPYRSYDQWDLADQIGVMF